MGTAVLGLASTETNFSAYRESLAVTCKVTAQTKATMLLKLDLQFQYYQYFQYTTTVHFWQ